MNTSIISTINISSNKEPSTAPPVAALVRAEWMSAVMHVERSRGYGAAPWCVKYVCITHSIIELCSLSIIFYGDPRCGMSIRYN